MSKLCRECGEPLADGAQFCKHCGTKVNKDVSQKKESFSAAQTGSGENSTESGQQTRQVKKDKKPMSKKQKIMTAIIGLLVLCGIGLGVWGNTYYSAEKTAERFASAIAEGDTAAIQKMVTVDGKEISDTEAEAVAATKETEGVAEISEKDPELIFDALPVFGVEESDNKAFLVFTQHHIGAEPQNVTVLSNVEGVTTTFNGEEFTEVNASSEHIEYGPLAPGIYEAASSFETDYGAAEKNRNVSLMNINGDNSYDSELEVGEVTFYEMFDSDFPYNSMELMINEEPLETNTDSDYVTAGPLLLDGSMELTGVLNTDWGEVQIEPIAITDKEHDVSINSLFTDEAEEAITGDITGFSEDYVEAKAKLDASVIENVSDELGDDLEDELFSMFDNNGFSGRLDEIGVAFSDAEYVADDSSDNPAFEIPVQLNMTGSYDPDSEYEETSEETTFTVQYQTDNQEWVIQDFREEIFPGNSEYAFLEASGEEYEGVQAEETMEDTDSTVSDEEDDSSDVGDEEIIEWTVESYVYSLADAVNTANYNVLSSIILPDSNLESMQRDLVDRLSDDGLEQEVVDVSVDSIEEVDSETWEVTTSETIELIYESGNTETEDYQWTYTVVSTDDGYQLSDLE
ncbi:TcaA NTF2-like domain-containing protein [Oceanobacillus timonensis]|uniref:TcaA NTF2-like domain-containing protein n=1 Tax=Oceanobacillus timonensis TaxID=1926285 RepID=UPI0009BA31CC|nr:zinc-ribbon domain-containing protein [Oceanobacillus timonensis]